MTRKQATELLYRLINSGILSESLEGELQTLANVICHGDFDKCEVDPRCEHGYPNYCEGCNHLGD